MITECEDLIKRLLCTDPSKRITLKDVAQHKWMKIDSSVAEIEGLVRAATHTGAPPPDASPATQPLDEVILRHMQTLSMNREDIIKVCILLEATASH